MQRRRWQVWHPVFFFAVLLAGFFPPLQVLDILEASPEDFFADQAAKDAAKPIKASHRVQAETWTSALPDAAGGSLAQRRAVPSPTLAGRAAAILAPRHRRVLLRPHLIRYASRSESSTADPS